MTRVYKNITIDKNVAEETGPGAAILHGYLLALSIDAANGLLDSEDFRFDKEYVYPDIPWVKVTLAELSQSLPGKPDSSTVKRHIKQLTEAGFISVKRFGHKYDRTNWYSVEPVNEVEL